MLKIYTDAAVNARGLVALAFHVVDGKGGQLDQSKEGERGLNNHQAEFEAVLWALREIRSLYGQEERLFLYTDSQIVEKALVGFIKDKSMFTEITEAIKKEMAEFPAVFVQWIPEKQNAKADQLAKARLRRLK
ncbi:hypothetical protein D3H64_09390 [Atopobacter sp. AH10]|uniref:ribonuclease HI family protein n=1 Tax=Atopobacter sp. AH10 TaxID=2315861 RepID=UPI000EF27167|nr:ribonuclease HI family protein [Atopobacter sp. AH10]RLK62471.1 hypothetical protein D3H64_09390 [Atopobacter sp. AH10]